MSSPNSISTPLQTERRFHERRRIEGLTYVDFGPDNGAILIDLAEGGLCFQSVAPVTVDQAVLLKFKLPGVAGYIESYAEVVWLNESGKGGGLRFVELTAETRNHIRAWMGAVSAPEAAAEIPAEANVGAAVAVNQTTAEDVAFAIQEPGAAESIPAAMDVAPAQLPEILANAESGVAEGSGLETAGPAPAPEILAAQAVPEVDAAPAPHAVEDARPAVLPASIPAPEQPAPQKIDATPAPQPEAPRPGIHSESAPVHPVTDRPATPRPPSDSSSQGVPSRVHSNILAASESSAAAAHSAVRPAKQAPVQPPTLSSPAQKPERPHAPSQPRSSLPRSYRENSPVSASLIRQSKKPTSADPHWNAVPDAVERPRKVSDPIAARALKIGIAAAAGSTLVLALVAIVPSLRTRVQATASARPLGSNVLPAAEFQVEVADLNNRRWILKSGGEAASPFVDQSSHRESAASPRNEASKSSARSGDSDNSGKSDTSANSQNTPQTKFTKPDVLALARPRSTIQAPAATVQLSAPSIFDGITPPIGSLADRLPLSGPNAPGPVSPQTPSGNRASLQSAVLVQRVAPVYPNLALEQRVQGEVRVNATIGKDGVPRDFKVVAGDQRLIQAAINAISQWRYRPAMLDGQAIDTQTTVSVSFELN